MSTYEDQVTERTGGQEQVDPGLDLSELDVEAARTKRLVSCEQGNQSTTVVTHRGEMTPHLLMRPLSWTTILPERWSSISSNSLM